MERYCIEIYAPKSKLDVLTQLYSDHPFLTISKGDFITQASLPQQTDSMKELRVTAVIHILMPSKDGTKHKVMIYTEEVEDIYSAF